MKTYLWCFILVIFAYNVFAQQPCYFCDSMPPYKHSIMVQANRGFDNIRGFASYLVDRAEYDGPQIFYADFRYGYRVHKNIIVGPELMFYSQKRLLVKETLHGTSINVGGYARFLVNRWQVFKPYADVGMSYNYAHSKYSWPDNYKPTDEEIQWFRPYNFHKYDAYIAPGMSFMIWRNHINVDLGVKISPFRSNVNSKMFVFTWKIGYNFNSK